MIHIQLFGQLILSVGQLFVGVYLTSRVHIMTWR